MKKNFWNSPEFKQLKKEWYQKLKDNNFNDIEIEHNGRIIIKQSANNVYRNANQVYRESKSLYYEALAHKLHTETNFRDDVEKLVMQRKSEGISIKLICEELFLMGKRSYRGTIRKIIKKYESKWHIKK